MFLALSFCGRSQELRQASVRGLSSRGADQALEGDMYGLTEKGISSDLIREMDNWATAGVMVFSW